jgi:hypothetical protein
VVRGEVLLVIGYVTAVKVRFFRISVLKQNSVCMSSNDIFITTILLIGLKRFRFFTLMVILILLFN